MDIKIISGKPFIRYRGSYVPADEYPLFQEKSNKSKDYINEIAEENKYLRQKVETLEYKLNQASFTNSRLYTETQNLYSEIDKYKRALREIHNDGTVNIDKNGNVSFPNIGIREGQHRDNTSNEMIETFRGIYEVWEEHPEFELMELISRLVNKRRGNVPIDDEEFVKSLKEVFDN